MPKTLDQHNFFDVYGVRPLGPTFKYDKYAYTLISVKFDKETRNTSLTFLRDELGRHSHGKKTARLVHKQMVLTNTMLEALPSNKDKLIAMNARYIVANIEEQSLFPSWYRKEIVKLQRKHGHTTESMRDIHPLPKDTTASIKFTPLKTVVSSAHKPLLGCYVIRNRENGRCYVGQSIDVYKRLREHFDGTKPRNYIFSDDYYASSNRENLFEVAVFRCESKSNLNEFERYLIGLFNANKTGYNKTTGNK